MKRVPAHVAAALALVSAGFVLLSPASVYAKENPGHHYGQEDNPGNHYGQLNNPGHHYGQLKHQTPSPAPAPQPVSQPASPAIAPAAAVISAAVPGLDAGAGSPAITAAPINLPTPVKTSDRLASQDVVPAGGLDWMILLILPALLAIWTIVVARMALTAARRRRQKTSSVLAGAPA
jgi:hypothetical protein